MLSFLKFCVYFDYCSVSELDLGFELFSFIYSLEILLDLVLFFFLKMKVFFLFIFLECVEYLFEWK